MYASPRWTRSTWVYTPPGLSNPTAIRAIAPWLVRKHNRSNHVNVTAVCLHFICCICNTYQVQGSALSPPRWFCFELQEPRLTCLLFSRLAILSFRFLRGMYVMNIRNTHHRQQTIFFPQWIIYKSWFSRLKTGRDAHMNDLSNISMLYIGTTFLAEFNLPPKRNGIISAFRSG